MNDKLSYIKKLLLLFPIIVFLLTKFSSAQTKYKKRELDNNTTKIATTNTDQLQILTDSVNTLEFEH